MAGVNALPSPAVALQPHPASTWQTALSVQVTLAVVASEAGPGLLLSYQLQGPASELACLHIPAAETPGPADGLWQSTCFELFVARQEHEAYREFNFSPSGRWACYAFSRERERTPADARPRAPEMPSAEWLPSPAPAQMVWVPAVLLPERPWHMGLSAVLAHRDGRLAYLALLHPKDRPDFHDRRGWTLRPELPPFTAHR
jgi:hypothetical protein